MEYITIDDVIYVAILAFFITWFIQNFIKFRRLLIESSQDGTVKDIKMVLERCYTLFPLESVNFKGQVFKRGMRVKITTFQDKTFEGELIGTNYRNLVCIMTNKLVVAHDLNNIRDISILEN